ncbi:MAG: flagellar assembly protein FliH [Rhodocyclaceae bacterium]|nr:flagellar assembly protein FliH [Rhodocyclaceae bacterium]MBX3678358.1 flagellar assembly protein FliH [Rhodocyclaceae bacterium]MCB1892105.1 flagellar assembly protein FliH [Rhodocyclaceae bacterium]MCP5297425.1 flagellar assembly protein FliH [Zoogloeaceae bacterium]MCW5596442.1 flagellar assembly protein FliH [Rhodocyclaceae bacterium]
MSNAVIPEERLTAWQRWELGSFDQNKAALPGTQKSTVAGNLPTAADVERIHQDAHKQGYDAGYEEGTARARMEALRLHTLVEQLDGALGEFDQQVAEALLQLSLDIARQVVRQAIAAKPAVILDVVREALTHLPHQHAALYLHPEDAALVRSHLGDQLAHLGHRIFEEASLVRGGLRLESGGSHLDAGVATRWRRVIESMGATGDWIEPSSL